jgi:uroporphyrinogen decarboxylase
MEIKMDSRERVLTAISRQKPDRVPIYLWLTPYLIERLEKERCVKDYEKYLKMDIRFVDYKSKHKDNDFSAYTKNFQPGTTVDKWGCGTFPVGYYHFTKSQHPMKDFVTAQEIEDYPFPVLEPNIEEMISDIRAIQNKGLLACSGYEMGTFEQGHGLMGMEEFLTNIYVNPDMIRLLCDRISDIKAQIAKMYVQAGVDMLFIGDDIGVQNGPIMNPKVWQEFLIPPLKKIINSARSVRKDIPIAYHSCGMIGWAVEGLIEAGVDILQSVQPEVNNCAELKSKFGNRISFWGGAGSQSTMSHGSTEDVRKEVKHLIQTVGHGGGYICSPAHFLEPETPLENIDAFLETIEKYGYYN